MSRDDVYVCISIAWVYDAGGAAFWLFVPLFMMRG